MADDPAEAMRKLVEARAAMDDEDMARLRAMSMRERTALIMSACEAAAAIYRSRLAAGLGPVEPDPWPASTWEFLRKHAARFKTQGEDEEIDESHEASAARPRGSTGG